jgi:hypothetical protein
LEEAAMKLRYALFVAVLGAAPAHADDTFESLTEEGIKALNGYAEVLMMIKDKATAETAKPDIKKIAEKVAGLKTRMEKLGEPGRLRKEELDKKYKPKMEATIKKINAQLDRIKDLDGGALIVTQVTSILNLDPKDKK